MTIVTREMGGCVIILPNARELLSGASSGGIAGRAYIQLDLENRKLFAQF